MAILGRMDASPTQQQRKPTPGAVLITNRQIQRLGGAMGNLAALISGL